MNWNIPPTKRSARSRNAPTRPDHVLIAADLLLSFVRGMGSLLVAESTATHLQCRIDRHACRRCWCGRVCEKGAETFGKYNAALLALLLALLLSDVRVTAFSRHEGVQKTLFLPAPRVPSQIFALVA